MRLEARPLNPKVGITIEKRRWSLIVKLRVTLLKRLKKIFHSYVCHVYIWEKLLQFTQIKPLFRSAVVVTKAPTMSYRTRSSEKQHTVRVNNSIFVVEIPAGTTLYVGGKSLRSRIATGNFAISVNVTIPVRQFNSIDFTAKEEFLLQGPGPKFAPGALPNEYPECAGTKWHRSAWFTAISHGLLGMLFTFCVLAPPAALFLMKFYRWYREIEKFRRSFEGMCILK